jgi:hypothetical protein
MPCGTMLSIYHATDGRGGPAETVFSTWYGCFPARWAGPVSGTFRMRAPASGHRRHRFDVLYYPIHPSAKPIARAETTPPARWAGRASLGYRLGSRRAQSHPSPVGFAPVFQQKAAEHRLERPWTSPSSLTQSPLAGASGLVPLAADGTVQFAENPPRNMRISCR